MVAGKADALAQQARMCSFAGGVLLRAANVESVGVGAVDGVEGLGVGAGRVVVGSSF